MILDIYRKEEDLALVYKAHFCRVEFNYFALYFLCVISAGKKFDL